MVQLTPGTLRAARASIVVLWVWTAGVSLLGLRGRSEALLLHTSVPEYWRTYLIVGGALLDATVGLALWRWHRFPVYLLAMANVLLMTLAGTLVVPSLWLDPLGSLTKNLPIAALLWVLYKDSSR